MSVEIFRNTKRTKRVHDTSLLSDMLCEMRGVADRRLSRAALQIGKSFYDNDGGSYDGYSGHSKGKEGAASGHARDLASEVYGKLFEDSERLENPTDSMHAKIHRALDSSEEFQTLKDVVDGDADFAAFATRNLLNGIQGQLSDLFREENERTRKNEEKNKEGDNSNGKPGNQDGEGNPSNEPGPPTRKEQALRRAISKAASTATQDVAEGKRMLGNVSGKGGFRPGNQDALNDEQGDRLELINAMNDSDNYKRIMKLAGRLKLSAKALKSKNKQRSVGAITSIERGGDIPRILPSQFAGLNHPVLRRLTLARIASGDALQYKMEEKEKEGRGPLIILVDESGSMDTCDAVYSSVKALKGMTNMTLANGLVMAMVSTAIRQKRDVQVIGFTSFIKHLTTFSKGKCTTTVSPNRFICVTDIEKRGTVVEISEAKAIGKVSRRPADGGTNFHRVMEGAFYLAQKNTKSDILFITDCGAQLYERDVAEYQKIKEDIGTRVFGVIIGDGGFGTVTSRLLDEEVNLNDGFFNAAGTIINASSST